MNVCSANNLSACGAPPFSFSSKEVICEEGSLPVVFVILFFSTIFAIKQLLYVQRKRNNNQKINGIMMTEASNQPSLFSIIGHHVEEVFIKPFVPTSLEDMITSMYFCYLLLTITMGVTRYYEKHWANDPFAQQGPFNLLSWAFGCETAGIEGLTYTPKMPDMLETSRGGGKQGLFQFLKTRITSKSSENSTSKNYFETIDILFTLHLIMGTAWLTIGFLQIVWTRTGWSIDKQVRLSAHRWFGRFAMISFVLHMGVASVMVYANPVKQALPIVIFYWIDIADNWIQCAMGIAWAIEAKRLRELQAQAIQEEEDASALHKTTNHHDDYQNAKNMHEFRMVTVYLRSTFGSGAIRFTVWILWLIGKFLPFEDRIKIDRGECQAYAQVLGSDQMGMAEFCLKPVFLNLAATDVFVVWLEWLFVCILAQEHKRLTFVDANATKTKLFGYVIAGFAYVASLCLDDSSITSYAVIFYALCTKLRVIHDHVGRFVSNLADLCGSVGDSLLVKQPAHHTITRQSITIDKLANFVGGTEDFPGLDLSESSFDSEDDLLEYSSIFHHPHQD